MKPRNLLLVFVLSFLINLPSLLAQQPATHAAVPRLIRFSGVITDLGGGPRTGVAGVTFSFYKEQEAGAALFMETQNVRLDSTGHYTALIGATKVDGVPTDLFASGEARWLGVQVEGQPEQPRVLLLSVPYALKAADAETLGGKPASAFLSAGPSQAASASVVAPAGATAEAAASGPSRGTAGFIARWTSNKTLGSAILFFQDGLGRVGIGTTTPLSLLHVNGLAQVGAGIASPTAMLSVAAGSPAFTGLMTTGFTGPASTDGLLTVGGDGTTSPGGVGANGLTAAGGVGAGPFGRGGNGIVASGGLGHGQVGGGGSGIVSQGGGGEGPSGAGGDGVEAFGGAGSHGGTGVFASGGSPSGVGLFATSTTGPAIFAQQGVPPSIAGDFAGDVTISGALTAGVKNFKIDHPLDPANEYLLHASVESSEMLDVYSGNATLDAKGEATVRLPQWFEAVNTDFRYQLTAVGSPSPGLYIAREIADHQFTIAGGSPESKVSWQVSAVRHDPYAKANPLIVEQPKSSQERGYYIHPKLYGAGEEKSIEWARYPAVMRKMKELRLRQFSMKVTASSMK